MFGIPITTLISLAITYGPEAVAFLKAADPLLHQLVVAAAPLATKVMQQFNTTPEIAVQRGVTLALAGAHNWTDAELRNWWNEPSRSLA